MQQNSGLTSTWNGSAEKNVPFAEIVLVTSYI